MRALLFRGFLLLALLASARAQDTRPAPATDPRTLYDVAYYRLDLTVLPEDERIEGVVGVRARALADGLDPFVLDCHRALEVSAVHVIPADVDDRPEIPLGAKLTFEHAKDQLRITLAPAVKAGGTIAVAIVYGGKPIEPDGFEGFHWRKTKSGQPWINTACQGIGAHTWWPCKAAFFHPEDKHERLDMNIVVPGDLYAACNGALRAVEEVDRNGGKWKRFRWRYDYPCLTYAVALNVAPYVELKDEVVIPGSEAPVPLRYYVLPEDVEKARKEFAVVPELLRFYSATFGPYPFPKAKFGLAQSSMWGMEHSSIVAYGNSWPASREPRGKGDPHAGQNRLFDYILIHESAHEWWGNAVSAKDWGHFWLHEGFATYAEALWVEHKLGAEPYHEYVSYLTGPVTDTPSVYSKRHENGTQAYNGNLYFKGACVLHMLRYVMGDERFFKALKAFQTDPRYRYANATTEDFRAACEKESGASLEWFFAEWIYGTGRPSIKVEKANVDGGTELVVSNTSRGKTEFRMPLDVTVRSDGKAPRRRFWLEPGESRHRIEGVAPDDVELTGLRWIVLNAGKGR